MAPTASGAQHQIAIVLESAFNTIPTTPVFDKIRSTGNTLGLSKAMILSGELRSDRMITDVRHGNKAPAGDFSFELSAEDFEDILEAVLQGTWATNVLKAGATARSYTMERFFSDITQYQRLSGCVLNTFALSVAPNAIVTGSVGVVAAGFKTDSAIETGATYNDPTSNLPFDSFSGTINEGGASIGIITAIDFALDNGAAADFVVGSDEAVSITSRRSNLTGTMVAFFQNQTLFDKFVDETASSIDFQLSDGTNTLTFDFPNVKYTGGDVPVNDEGPITISLPFQAVYDGTDATSFKITRSA